MAQTDLILGIESSCDDTAAAVVSSDRRILSSIVVDQTTLHAAFGGVVPEIAARAHAEKLDIAAEQALRDANVSLAEMSAIAVTAGPGLIGGVISGVMTARGLAASTGLPLIGVNHLAGHALTPRLTDNVSFPYLMLLASGGHCQLLIVHSATDFDRLGGTIDDAPGEAFDKVARILGLGQPGGPAVEDAARDGDPNRYALPRPLLDRDDCDMSFSGLKTAVLRTRDAEIESRGGLSISDRSDLCASFQAAVSDVLATKTARALRHYMALRPSHPALAVAGGVAANSTIRSALSRLADEAKVAFVAPPLSLCTDNAAMIAWAAAELRAVDDPGMVPLVPRPRWPLDPRPPAMLGSGKRGAKA